MHPVRLDFNKINSGISVSVIKKKLEKIQRVCPNFSPSDFATKTIRSDKYLYHILNEGKIDSVSCFNISMIERDVKNANDTTAKFWGLIIIPNEWEVAFFHENQLHILKIAVIEHKVKFNYKVLCINDEIITSDWQETLIAAFDCINTKLKHPYQVSKQSFLESLSLHKFEIQEELFTFVSANRRHCEELELRKFFVKAYQFWCKTNTNLTFDYELYVQLVEMLNNEKQDYFIELNKNNEEIGDNESVHSFKESDLANSIHITLVDGIAPMFSLPQIYITPTNSHVALPATMFAPTPYAHISPPPPLYFKFQHIMRTQDALCLQATPPTLHTNTSQAQSSGPNERFKLTKFNKRAKPGD